MPPKKQGIFLKEIVELYKRGSGDGSPPAEFRGGAPVGALEDKVPRS